MNMNLSPRRLWINSNAQYAHQFWLHIHRWKYGIPLQNAQTRFIHMWKFFTAFSRVFHGLFTFLVSALFLYFSMTIFNFRRKQEDMFQTTSDNFRSSKCRTGPLTGKRPSFKPVASWQVAGNIPGNMFFYSYLIRRNVEWDQYMTIAALHFAT